MDDDLDRTMDLLRRAQSGDKAALNELFRRYGPRLLPIVRLRLGPGLRRRLDSGDIVQEAILAALRSLGGFVAKDESSLLDWLSKIAENRIRDAADKFGADKRDADREVPLVSSNTTGPVPLDPPASGPTPEEAADRAAKKEELEAALCEMAAEERELIIQRDYLELEWNEIATKTGHPSGAAARMAHGKVLVELGARILARRSGR